MFTNQQALRYLYLIAGIFTYTMPIFSQIPDYKKQEMGNLVAEGIPEIPKSLSEKLFQYQNVRGATFATWLPDGESMLISTRFGETAQLHKVEMPKGARQQITFFPEPLTSATFGNAKGENKTFYFRKDVGGGEFFQIFSFDLTTGKYEMITDGSKAVNGFPNFNNTSTQFVYASTKRNKTDYDLYIADKKSPKEAKLLKELKGSWSPRGWSPDDSQLLVSNFISANEIYLHILDIKTAEMLPINAGKKGIAYGSAAWAKDGKGIYISSDEDSEFQNLRFYDIERQTWKNLTEKIKWDISDIEISEDGKKLAFTANEDGISKLYLMDTRTQKYEAIKSLPLGVLGGLSFAPNNRDLALTINSATTPSDVFVLNTDNKNLTRWTYSEIGGLNSENFVSPTLIHYPTFDKRQIPAFYYSPKKAKGKIPVLIVIHGGPEAQSLPTFNSQYQYMVNEMGIAILVPNVRGSSGYGKTYLQLDNGMKREESVQDIGTLLDWIAQQPELDATKVMVNGGSYGGYMTLACMTNFNDRLRGGIDLFGISNFVTFLEKTESYRRDLRRGEYGDERVPEMRTFLEKISPVNNVGKITKPMFIYQGLNDPRVPVGESEQMVKALRDKNIVAWYLLAKDEGHSLAKKFNRDYHTAATVLFIEQYLLK